jgi:hypothetical protein
VVVELLTVGQGLLAQVAGFVVGVAGGEDLAVELAAVFNQFPSAVVAEGFAALVVLQAGQAAGLGVVVEPGAACGATLFDQPVDGVVAVVGALAVWVGLELIAV